MNESIVAVGVILAVVVALVLVRKAWKDNTAAQKAKLQAKVVSGTQAKRTRRNLP